MILFLDAIFLSHNILFLSHDVTIEFSRRFCNNAVNYYRKALLCRNNTVIIIVKHGFVEIM